MNDMKCPFCQQEIRKIHPTYFFCDNCRIAGEDELWQSLIDTTKKLDLAIGFIESLRSNEDTHFWWVERANRFFNKINNKETK